MTFKLRMKADPLRLPWVRRRKTGVVTRSVKGHYNAEIELVLEAGVWRWRWFHKTGSGKKRPRMSGLVAEGTTETLATCMDAADGALEDLRQRPTKDGE